MFALVGIAKMGLPLLVLISMLETESIGKKIYRNECSEKEERLVWWNRDEAFPSLGIGHFIWYPKGVQGPFQETFPELLIFLKENKVVLPAWCSECPWKDREDFLSEKEKRRELQEILISTIGLQTTFMIQRFEKKMPSILSAIREDKRENARQCVERLLASARGTFALIDYLNFKGDGLSETEQYLGKGWGLKQVLEEMPAHPQDPLKTFVDTARGLLRRRVENAPRQEGVWLKGWLDRVDRYTQVH